MSQSPDWNPAGGQPAYQQPYQQQPPPYQQQQPPPYQQPAYQQQPYQQQPFGQVNPQAAMAPAGYGMPGVAPVQVPPGMYLDQMSGLVLPLGTQLAPVGRRIGAYFLGILLSIVTLGIGYAIWGLIAWGKGQTPAQQVLGMQTWKPQTATNATWGTMFLRELSFVIVNVIPFGQIVSFVLFVTGKERKTLHDSIAGTIVLHDPNKVLRPVRPGQAQAR